MYRVDNFELNIDEKLINQYISSFPMSSLNQKIKDIIDLNFDKNNIEDAILLHGIKNVSNVIMKQLLKEIDDLKFSKIHPIKREKVKKACQYVKEYPFIKKMIIFGSAITDYCTNESDIDICLMIDKNKKQKDYIRMYGELPLYIDDLCDILIYDKLNKDWQKQIDEKGVVVYEFEESRS